MKKISTLILFLASIIGFAQTAYITNEGDNTVSVINVTTNTVVATITVGVEPLGVSVSSDGTKVYTTNYSHPNTVEVISTTTNTVSASITVGSNPAGLCVSPDGSKVYVANVNSNSVSVINTGTNTVSATVPVDYGPWSVSVSPDGSKVYVGNYFGNSVSVINTVNNVVSTIIPLGFYPTALCVSPDGSKIYVANWNNNTVNVIDTITNTVTITIPVGSGPNGISISPDGSKVYVTNWGDSSVSVINTAIESVSSTIAVGRQPFGISVTPDGSEVYVASGDSSVNIINTTTNTVSATITVGYGPAAFGNFISPHTICDALQPVITANGNTTFCQGNSVILTSSVSAHYVWYNNTGTTQTITVFNPGNYFVDIIDSNNCFAQSAITAVTVIPSDIQNITASICHGDSYTFPDGIISSVDTVETSYFTGMNTCDSIIVTTLTVIIVDTSVSVYIPMLMANFTDADGFQWINCNTMSLIPGAVFQNYTAVANGSYAVIVTYQGCSDTSSCYDILSVGVNGISNQNNLVTLYPNPTSGTFTLSYNSQLSIQNSQLKIYDVLGQEVYTQAITNPNQTTITISQLSNGVYFYQLTNNTETYRGKFVKD